MPVIDLTENMPEDSAPSTTAAPSGSQDAKDANQNESTRQDTLPEK
jgi:hypothetical protein